jgi:hypothetical protein
MTTYITIGIGKYADHAKILKGTMDEHGWQSPLIIVGDGADADVQVTDTYNGREHKTKFADYIPADTPRDSTIVFIDADSRATGPEPVWDFSEGDILCRAIRITPKEHVHYPAGKQHPINGVFPDSFLMVFNGVEVAKNMCEMWHKEWTNSPLEANKKYDAYLLIQVASQFEFTPAFPSEFEPVDGIEHLQASRRRDEEAAPLPTPLRDRLKAVTATFPASVRAAFSQGFIAVNYWLDEGDEEAAQAVIDGFDVSDQSQAIQDAKAALLAEFDRT